MWLWLYNNYNIATIVGRNRIWGEACSTDFVDIGRGFISSVFGGIKEKAPERVRVWDQEFNGVLTEDKIPPFEMWREILMFL